MTVIAYYFLHTFFMNEYETTIVIYVSHISAGGSIFSLPPFCYQFNDHLIRVDLIHQITVNFFFQLFTLIMACVYLVDPRMWTLVII